MALVVGAVTLRLGLTSMAELKVREQQIELEEERREARGERHEERRGN